MAWFPQLLSLIWLLSSFKKDHPVKFLSIFHFLNHFQASESRIKNFSIDLRYDFQIQAFWLVKSSPMASKQPTITVKFQHSVNLCLKIYLQYRAQLVQVKIWPQQSHLRKTLIGISSAAAAYEDFCVQLIWMHRTKESFETPASVPIWNCLFEIEKKANFWSPYKLEICLFWRLNEPGLGLKGPGSH